MRVSEDPITPLRCSRPCGLAPSVSSTISLAADAAATLFFSLSLNLSIEITTIKLIKVDLMLFRTTFHTNKQTKLLQIHHSTWSVLKYILRPLVVQCLEKPFVFLSTQIVPPPSVRSMKVKTSGGSKQHSDCLMSGRTLATPQGHHGLIGSSLENISISVAVLRRDARGWEKIKVK